MDGGLGSRDRLLLQRLSARADSLRDRLRDAGRGADDDDQHRRLRSRQDPYRTGGAAGVQGNRGRAARADVHSVRLSSNAMPFPHSTERFLTTHTGSLPRPADLIRTMYAKEEGVPVDSTALEARIRAAVAERVGRQVEAGVDLVNDGEMSKPSYATYVKDRLSGFGGQSHPLAYRDLSDFPEMAARVFGDPGRSRRRTPACNAAISVRDPRAAQRDADNLKAAVGARAGFMSAASPGVISLFFRNEHYPNHEAYLFAIAEAMRQEYEAIAAAGFVVQVDCPDLGMGRHIQYADLDIQGFRKAAELHIAALNHALARVPAEQARVHICWGNYEGPHHFDVPLGHHRPDLHDPRERHLLRGVQPAPRPRVACLREREAAGGQGPDPRCPRLHDQLHRAPGPGGRADRALRETGRARECHRGDGLWLWHVGRAGRRRAGHRVGETGEHG